MGKQLGTTGHASRTQCHYTMHRNTLRCIAVYRSTSQCIAMHRNMSQCIATHCNALQHITMYCNTSCCITMHRSSQSCVKMHPAPNKHTHNNQPNNTMSSEEDEPTPGDLAATGSPLSSVTLSHPQPTTIESTTAVQLPPLFEVRGSTSQILT